MKTGDELLQGFYEYMDKLASKKTTPLDKAESIVLIMFGRWLEKHYTVTPKT